MRRIKKRHYAKFVITNMDEWGVHLEKVAAEGGDLNDAFAFDFEYDSINLPRKPRILKQKKNRGRRLKSKSLNIIEVLFAQDPTCATRTIGM